MKKITILLIALLVATISYSQTTIFSENFNGATVPTDWHPNNDFGTGGQVWTFGSGVVPGSGSGSGDNDFGTNAAIFDDDASTNDGNHDNVYLWFGGGDSGFDVSSYGQVTLTYDYAFNKLADGGASNETLTVAIWDNAGGGWIPIKVYDTDADPTTDSIDVTAAINAYPAIDPTAIFVGFGYDDVTSVWGFGAGIDNVIMTGSAQPANDSIFRHTVTADNTSAHTTRLDHPDLDGNPDAKIVVSNNWNPGGGAGVFNDNIHGVYYSGGKWRIYNEDQATAMVLGATYNVYIRGNDSNVITVIQDDLSFPPIDNPTVNGDPNAIIVIDHYWNPNNVVTNFNCGVWYDGSMWHIYREDGIIIDAGAAFHVVLESSNANVASFRHQATAGNITSNWTVIDHALLNGKPDAVFVFTHNWGAAGDISSTNIDETQGVWYNGTNWAIFNEETTSAMTEGSLYNIVVQTTEVVSTNTNELTNFTTYPNPVDDVLHIDSQEEITKIAVYNLLGQEVKTMNPISNNFDIDLSSLDAGVYIVKLTSTDNRESSKKIVKK